MFKRIIVLLVLLPLKMTLCLDPICEDPILKDWNAKVERISAAVRTKERNEVESHYRKIPLCIGMRNDDTEPWNHMKDFLPIFDEIKEKENQDSYRVGLSDNEDGRSPEGYVEEISFSRITVPEKSMTNLRQWVHIQFKVKSLQGLIVQPICMPLGLPCGEFKVYPVNLYSGGAYTRTNIECGDCNHMQYNHMFQAPCLYRPKASVIHPHVWVFKSDTPANELHTSFVWLDVMCQELLSLQFLIVAVKQFSPRMFEIYYSPVYSNKDQDGIEGSPYLWSKAAFGRQTKCHGGSQSCSNCKPADPIKLGKTRTVGTILPYNKEYDDCIKNKTGINNECPPGPFKCYIDRATTAEQLKPRGIDLGNTQETYRTGLEAQMKGCKICPPPEEQREVICEEFLETSTISQNTDSTINQNTDNTISQNTDSTISQNTDSTISQTTNLITPNDTITLGRKFSLPIYEELLTSSVLLKRAENRNHGTLMILAWFVLTMSSIFISRFLKESAGITGNASVLGMGWWLWCHVLLAFLTLGVMWMGISSITYKSNENPYTCGGLSNYVHNNNLNASQSEVVDMNKFCKSHTSVKHFHKVLGYITIILLYVDVLLGWARPMMKSLRVCSITAHVFLGYFSVVLAAVGVLSSHACYEIKYITVGIVSLNLLILFSVTFLQVFIDGKEKKERALCPVLGVSEIGRCGLLKAMLLLAQCVLTLILYVLILWSYAFQRDIQDENMDKIWFSDTRFSKSKTWCPSYGAGVIVGTILSEFWD